MNKRKPRCYWLTNSEASITETELWRYSHAIQLDVMNTWFYSNYENPAESTPYESAEGGYVYIWGGPYDPEEALRREFEGLIPDEVINELVEELLDISYEWGGHPEYDDIDDYFFTSIAQTTEHYASFNNAIANVEHLLTTDTIDSKSKYLLRLLYVNVITILETYLSDLFISAVGNDKSLLRSFVETTPEFKSKKISVSEIFKEVDKIEKEARSYLMDIVWHHLKKVRLMFKDTLDLNFPTDIQILYKAVIVRHDLVHRNGKKKDDGEHDISIEMTGLFHSN